MSKGEITPKSYSTFIEGTYLDIQRRPERRELWEAKARSSSTDAATRFATEIALIRANKHRFLLEA
jgi:hypothetical protein